MIYLYLFIYLVIGWVNYLILSSSSLYQDELYNICEKHQVSTTAMDTICFFLILLFWPFFIISAIIDNIWKGLSN